MRPKALIDVDGVINALGGGPFETVFQAHGGFTYYTISVPVGTADRIAQIEEHFDPIWCTTWLDRAVSELAPQLGFGAEWPIMHLEVDGRNHHPTWKLPSVKKWLADQEPPVRWVWFDDDVADDAIWYGRRVGGLVVSVDPTVGLTDTDMYRALAWVGVRDVQDDAAVGGVHDDRDRGRVG
jgi:hypothetical protein